MYHSWEKTGMHTVLVVKPGGNNHWEDLEVDGRIMLKYILEKYDGGVDRINLAQKRDQLTALVNTAINVWFP
jgi:hypothetical protein